MQLTRTAKHNLALVGVGLFVLVAIVVAVLAVSPRNVMSGPPGETTSHQNNVPLAGLELPLTHLEGTWQYQKDGEVFTATVVGNDIKIEWGTGDGTTATYWHGTFQTAESPGNVIKSTKTENHDEIVLSQSGTKDFTIGQNTIAFDFAAMGFKTKVVMSR